MTSTRPCSTAPSSRNTINENRKKPPEKKALSGGFAATYLNQTHRNITNGKRKKNRATVPTEATTTHRDLASNLPRIHFPNTPSEQDP
jgi:hypothetical protein